MTTRKKLRLGLGFGLAIILTGLALSLFGSGKSLAYTAGQINANRATTKYNFTAKDAKTITMSLPGKTLHFDLTNAAPDPGSAQSAVSYIYQLRDGEDTNDNCRVGAPPGGVTPQTASIRILRPAIDTNPDSKIDARLSFFHLVDGKCQMTSDIQSEIQVNNSFGKDLVVAGGTGPGGGGGASAETCESNGTLGLEWIFCPILRGIDKVVNSFYGEVEKQLCFKVGANVTAGDTRCTESVGYLTPKVKDAWSSIRIIATSLLVIAMLVMVISQALGGNFLDAYTIRKLLPKLVVAAILIQISWYLGKFAVGLFNDIGTGIGDLLTAPFGPNVSDIDNALAPIGRTGVLTLGLFSAVIATAAVFSGLTVMGIVLLGVPVVLAVLVGYLVLVFRQILILLCILIIPLALVAWVLPGTERYWKLWRETFVKLLVMFPMIMALIAAGRIFGTVGGKAGGITGLIIVLVGFFGPLAVLPKTFNWGGAALGALGGAVINGTKGLRGKPKEIALSGAQTNRAVRREARSERLSYNKGRFGDRAIASLGGIPLSRGARRIRQARNLAEGREAGEKAVGQAIVGSAYESLDHAAPAGMPSKLNTLTNLAQGQLDEHTGLDGSNPTMQRWALDQLATFGDWDRIDTARTQGNIDERTWQSFVAKNISAIHQNAPHLSPIRRDLSQLGYEEMGGWKDHTFQEFERQISTGQRRTADAKGFEAVPDQDAQQSNAVAMAEGALTDDRVRARLSPTAIAALERVRDMDSPEVRTRRDRATGQTTASLPSARLIGGGQGIDPARAADARRNLTRSLVDPTQAPIVTGALATQLANPGLAPNHPDRVALENYLGGLRRQAGNSSEAKQAYNEVLQEWNTQVAARVQQAEREAIAAGQRGPQLTQTLNNAQAAVTQEQQRMQTVGLTPLP